MPSGIPGPAGETALLLVKLAVEKRSELGPARQNRCMEGGHVTVLQGALRNLASAAQVHAQVRR